MQGCRRTLQSEGTGSGSYLSYSLIHLFSSLFSILHFPFLLFCFSLFLLPLLLLSLSRALTSSLSLLESKSLFHPSSDWCSERLSVLLKLSKQNSKTRNNEYSSVLCGGKNPHKFYGKYVPCIFQREPQTVPFSSFPINKIGRRPLLFFPLNQGDTVTRMHLRLISK